jgi:tripartite-type tricarboxylate transporter receptor subunit TctC
MSRCYGAKLSELWGQPVIVESKPGAAGSIGMDFAAKQPNDGYTFVVGNLQPVAVNPLLSQVPYSIRRISSRCRRSRRAERPRGAGRLAVQVARRRDRVRQGESRQAQLRHQRSGQRVAPLVEMLKNITKAQVVEVPYKGGVLAVQDLLGGQIQFIFSDTLRPCSTSAPASCARCA